MIALEQRFKDLYSTYGGKSIRLVFYKKEYHTPYPSSGLMPSYRLYPSQTETDIVDFVIGNDMIHTDTLTITESLCSNEDLDFGACEAASMEIVVSGNKYIKALYPHDGLYPSSGLVPADNLIGREFALVESFYSLDEIYPHNGLYPSEDHFPSRDIVRGIFTVNSVPKEDDRDTRRIIAYDRMEKLNQDVSDWYESITFPITLKRFRAGLCSYAGIPEVPASLVNDDLIVEKTLDTEVLNGRDLIRYICQINGVFGNINHNGEFRYVTIPKKNQITDTVTRYKSVDSEEYVVTDIDAVKIRQEEGDIGGFSSAQGNNFYIVEGNILAFGKTTAELNAIATKIKTAVSDLSYRPATIVGNGAPWYEVGDRLVVKTSDGDVNTVIMSRTTTGIQGPMETIEATGSQELSQVFNVESQIIQAKGLVAKLKLTVEEVSSELINFEEQTSTKFTQTAEKIELEAKRATEAEEQLSAKITVTAEQITSEVTKIITDTETRLGSRITQTADLISAEVTRATAAEGNLSASIKITADEITSEVRRAQNAESNLSSRITQTADRIDVVVSQQSVKNDLLSLNISMTAEELKAEVTRATEAEGTLSSSLKITADKVETKVSKGDVSSTISQESDKITITSNRLIVTSTNFKLDGDGNVELAGKITGGSISIVGSKFAFNVTSKGVTLGDFIVNDEWGRNIFMSKDEVNGMSTGDANWGGYYLWAGYGYGPYDIDSLFLVNTSQVHATSEFYLHGSRGNINVYSEIKNLWNAIGNAGGSCNGDSDCYSCNGDSCYTCLGDHSACGPGASGTAQ